MGEWMKLFHVKHSTFKEIIAENIVELINVSNPRMQQDH